MTRLWRRLVDVVVHRILGVDDTPHRIAWGVLLGFVVAWTPTLGFQIMIYVAIASLLRANKISGIPILFISNPFTAVPLYWFCWWVGAFILRGGNVDSDEGHQVVQERLAHASGEQSWLTDIFTAHFWMDLGQTLLAMGGELWLGSFVLGFATGVPSYFVTRWAVRAYRAARGRD
jgi:uncharacterized protein (DUF2062 family)